jgi:acyl carrier protein
MSVQPDSIALIEVIKQAVPHLPLVIDDHNKSFEAYGLDSIDTSAIFMGVEEAYDIAISDKQLEDLECVNDILKLLAVQS